MKKRRAESTPPSVSSTWGFPLGLGFLIAVGLFLLLPITQWIEGLNKIDRPEITTADLPPPPPPLELEEPEEEEVEEEEIEELEPPPPPPTLEMLELALSADLGSMAGDFSLPSFDVSGDLADTIFSLDEIDQPPRGVVQQDPQYPIELRRAGIEGQVVIEFIVDENGNVRNPTIYRSQNPGFNEAALRAVRSWRFEPGIKGGKPVKVRVRIPMTFDLN